MPDSDLAIWYRSVPEISRYWFTGSIVLPLLGRLGVLSPYWCVLEWTLFLKKFQIWRPITALFYYPITPSTGFHYLIMLYFLYSYSTRLESGVFDGRTADYLVMLIFNWICITIIALFAEIYVLLEPMVLSILYIWCQLNKDTIVQFWFGTQFKAMYLPWVLVAFNMIIRGGGMNELIGILVGHLYYFLMFRYPQEFGGRQFINTPQFLYNWFPNRRGGVHGFGSAPQNRPAAPGGGGGRHNWGRGQTLGEGNQGRDQ